MQRPAPETVQVVKQRRDTALRTLTDAIPYLNYLGVEFDRRGDELTAILPYRDDLIGNPMLPALHGGGHCGVSRSHFDHCAVLVNDLAAF